jgi:hypothetical protein
MKRSLSWRHILNHGRGAAQSSASLCSAPRPYRPANTPIVRSGLKFCVFQLRWPHCRAGCAGEHHSRWRGRGRVRKRELHDIWTAPSKSAANDALDRFKKVYGIKDEKATQCLMKDRDGLLQLHDLSGENWKHLRPTNPIERTW